MNIPLTDQVDVNPSDVTVQDKKEKHFTAAITKNRLFKRNYILWTHP